MQQPGQRSGPQVAPPQDAVPLAPTPIGPNAGFRARPGPSIPEPDINPPAAPDSCPETAPSKRRRSRRSSHPDRPRLFDVLEQPAPRADVGLWLSVGHAGRYPRRRRPRSNGGGDGTVWLSRTPDSRDWRPSFPEAAGKCVEIPDLGRNPDGSPVLATVLGRVYEADGRTPLIGAHLQIMGTTFVTFSGPSGDYRLEFDPRLLERCRVQYVRVAAEGYDGRMLTLSIGRKVRSDDVLLRRR